jgi:hypothetical protein
VQIPLRVARPVFSFMQSLRDGEFESLKRRALFRGGFPSRYRAGVFVQEDKTMIGSRIIRAESEVRHRVSSELISLDPDYVLTCTYRSLKV